MRVLICEDNRADFVLLSRRLSSIGISSDRIEHVETVAEAHEALARNAHDVAFVDYKLADGSGFDVLREATAIGWTAPIIMLTGMADPEIDRSAMLLGACDFLRKDELKPEWIERSIRYASERKRLEALTGETNLELLRHIRELAEAKAEIESMHKRVVSLAHYLAASDGGGRGDDQSAAQTALGIWRFDADGRTRSANKATLDLFELEDEADLASREIEALLPEDSRSRLKAELRRLRGKAAATVEVELIGQHSGGHRWVVMSLVAGPCSEAEVCYVATVVDVTTRRNVESANRYLARHDALTGLANRSAFNERLAHDTSVARRNGSLVALLCIDLDRFKDVNDSYGHPMGDALLKAVALRLHESARESDTVARLGGDEFAVIATNLREEKDALRIVEKLESLFDHPFAIGDKQLFCGASIGCSIFPTMTEDLEALFDQSDAALYREKRRRGGALRT